MGKMTEDIPYVKTDLGSVKAKEKFAIMSIPNLLRKKSIKEGFSLNLLVVGRRGLGSRTLINSLFASPIVDKNRDDSLTTRKSQLFENEICLNTSVTTCHSLDENEILNFIEQKNYDYLNAEESFIGECRDVRIHACLFLIPNDRLSKNELKIMKEVGKKTNLITVLPKADIFTSKELIEVKLELNNIFNNEGISIFKPSFMSNDDKEYREDILEISSKTPFAVIASEDFIEMNGQKIRAREYSWGWINIEAEHQNDFLLLRKVLIYSHLLDLVEKMDIVFYNSFRKEKLKKNETDPNKKRERLSRIKKEIENIINEKKIEKERTKNAEEKKKKIEKKIKFEKEIQEIPRG